MPLTDAATAADAGTDRVKLRATSRKKFVYFWFAESQDAAVASLGRVRTPLMLLLQLLLVGSVGGRHEIRRNVVGSKIGGLSQLETEQQQQQHEESIKKHPQQPQLSK